MDTENFYREEILDHYQNPHNFGKLNRFDKHSHQTNPLCGDDIEMFIKVKSNKVHEISFQGKGCAICIAGASILTDFALGKAKNELTKFSEQDMLSLLGIQVSQTRKKCALLSLAVLKDCVKSNPKY